MEKELFIAANGVPQLVEMLLDAGANPQHAPDVCPSDKELSTVISKYGKRTSKTFLNEELVYLCRGDRGGNPEQVRAFLDSGAEVNHQDHKGKTALHRAAKAGFLKTIPVLLKHGADLEIKDKRGETPLFDAVRSTIRNFDKQKETVRMLIAAGANRSHKNARGQTVSEVAGSKKIKSETISLRRLLRGR